MEWKITHQPDGNILWVEVAGTLTAGPMSELAREVIGRGAEQGCSRVLVDQRKVGVELSVLEIFSRPMELERLGFDRAMRVAHVFPKLHWERFAFLENVMLNRGYQIRIFRDEAAALTWLKQ